MTAQIIVLIVAAVTLIVAGRNLVLFFRKIAYHFWGDFINRNLLMQELKPKYKRVIEQNSKYYRQLSTPDKILFERRMQKFINLKHFIPRGSLKEVTPEMKAMIAATAVQITFGYPSVYFEHFKKILLYPDSYYSTINRTFHLGEVNLRGYIILSWKSFEEGYKNPADGINLGLHEMAHALKLENTIINSEYKYLDEENLSEFRKLAPIKMALIRAGEAPVFRRGAGTNWHELFAVAVENFFERPTLLKQEHPRLFKIMCVLLKQNPIADNRK
jgi:MtfA peptidase